MNGEETSNGPIAISVAVLIGIIVVGILTGKNGDETPSGSALGSGIPAAGRIHFLRDATSQFDPYISSSTPTTRRFMHKHYWRMRGYPPFFNQALTWAPPTQFYDDLYAIYRDRRTDGAPDARLIARHPEWVLRDALGRPLYIPFDCKSGSCTQYAADVGSPGWRDYWIDRAKRILDEGYAGIFLDDVNLEMKVGDGEGRPMAPIDPRTGQAMTEESWRRYIAEFTAQIREALPDAEIAENIIWYADPSDPWVKESIDDADDLQLERGFSDSGIVGGDGDFGYQTLLGFIDTLHEAGKGVIFKPYFLDAKTRMYEVASYFLTSAGRDSIAAELEADPGNWWRGWEVDLGAPRGARYFDDGLLRRDFEKGMVLVNEPEAKPQRFIPDGEFVSLSGSRVDAVQLAAGQGEVLLKAK